MVAIGVGGALGALLRYGVSIGVHALAGRGFPYGTLVVNVLGCLAIGIVYVLFLERMITESYWRAAIQIGFLGAFTTFSTFSIETLLLMENGEMGRAILNVILSVILCLGMTWFGILLGRQI